MYHNGMKNIEIPENLFSNLGELKSKQLEKERLATEQMSEQNPEKNDIKLTNFSNRKEYRKRINRMYEDIKDIKPIDHEVADVLFFNNYIEKGIVIKPKISSLKQFWTEYRLINNEKHKKPIMEKGKEEQSTNFDELFEALSMRVHEINKYIDELKAMRKNMDISSTKLEEDKEKLSNEKKKFLDYKNTEETKIKEEKETLKINFERLQTIIDDLDKKLESIDK